MSGSGLGKKNEIISYIFALKFNLKTYVLIFCIVRYFCVCTACSFFESRVWLAWHSVGSFWDCFELRHIWWIIPTACIVQSGKHTIRIFGFMFVSILFKPSFLNFNSLIYFLGESKPSCDAESHQSSHHEHGQSKPQEISSPPDVCCINISVKVYKSFMKMMNLGLLKDPIFVLFTVSDFATSLGYYVPYFIICDQATELGIAKEEASHLLSIIGILNTLSRIIWGYVSDKSWVNRLYVYNICLAICGIGKICFFCCCC